MQPHRWQPTRLNSCLNSPGKNTGVGCHFLLQCMKVKSESEVSQSCPTLSLLDYQLFLFYFWSVSCLFQLLPLPQPAMMLNSCHWWFLTNTFRKGCSHWVRLNEDKPWEWKFPGSCQTGQIRTVLWVWDFGGTPTRGYLWLFTATVIRRLLIERLPWIWGGGVGKRTS